MNTAQPPPAPVAPLDQSLKCPSCHTVLATSTDVAHQSGSDWQCHRCGEHWTATRLATVAEYQAWDREHGGTNNTAPAKALASVVMHD